MDVETWNQRLVYYSGCESIMPVVFDIVGFGREDEGILIDGVIVNPQEDQGASLSHCCVKMSQK